jgi:hypothetical protein
MKGKNTNLNYVEVDSDHEQDGGTKANQLQMLSSQVTITSESAEGTQTQRTQQLTDTSNMSSTIDDASIDEPYSTTNQANDDDHGVQGIRKTLPNLKLHIPLSIEQGDVLRLFH